MVVKNVFKIHKIIILNAFINNQSNKKNQLTVSQQHLTI